MESLLQSKLNLERLEPMGRTGGGSISRGVAYHSDIGDLFVKSCKRDESRLMFEGEMSGLSVMLETDTVVCPRPFGVYDLEQFGNCLVTEYIQMDGRNRREALKVLGKQLAEMHLHNPHLLKLVARKERFVGGRENEGEEEIADSNPVQAHVDTAMEDESAVNTLGTKILPVKQFGFTIPTCCGAIPQNNTWQDSWPEFFVQNRLKTVIEQIIEKHGDRDLLSAYSVLIDCCQKIFSSDFYGDVFPSLVHGDLHGGNWEAANGQPVIFDPSVSYSDPEFEAGIMEMFGGFDSEFWAEYHKLLPRRKGDRQRIKLYELYHHLNHWNHFGTAYKHSSMDLIRMIQRQT